MNGPWFKGGDMLNNFMIGVRLMAVITTAIMGFIILTRLKSKKREFLVLAVLCTIIHTSGDLLEQMASTIDGGLIATRLGYMGAMLIAPLYLVFVQNYCEKKLPKIVNFLLFATAFFVILLVWTSPLHDLFYTSYYYDNDAPIHTLAITRGPLYPLGKIHPAVCAVISVALLIQRMQSVAPVKRKRLGFLTFCAVIPGISQLLTLFTKGIFGIDFTIVFVVIAIIVVYFGIAKYDLLENEETTAMEKSMREQALAAENAALDRHNRMKTELIATITHETMTPLAVLSGYAELIAGELRRKGVDDQTARDLDNIAEETQRIAELMDELHIQAREQDSHRSKSQLNLHKLIEGTVRLYTPILARKDTVLTVSIPDDLPDVYACAGEVTQVLFNLLQNARNHTENGEVCINAVNLDEFIAVTVSDTGSGIQPKLLPHVFERGVSGNENGNGLGLSICKDIITSHEGTIEITSEPGKWTAVRFTLPVMKEVNA